MTQFLIDHGANLPTNEQSTNELFHMIHLSHNYLHKDVIKTLFKNGVPVPNSYKNDPGVMQAQREITAENQEKTQGVSALTLEQKRRNTKFAMTMAQLLGIDPKYFKETPAPGTSTAT